MVFENKSRAALLLTMYNNKWFLQEQLERLFAICVSGDDSFDSSDGLLSLIGCRAMQNSRKIAYVNEGERQRGGM